MTRKTACRTVAGYVVPLTFTLLVAMASSTLANEVSGGLFADTTWVKSESPYIMTSDVVLFPDKTLTIEPGVTVLGNPNTSLTIRGPAARIA